MSGVVLATAGYDHTIRFWDAASGTCNRTVKYQDSVSYLYIFFYVGGLSETYDGIEFVASELLANHTR